MKKGWAFDFLALAASLAAFGFLSLRQLDLPGLYYDEAADAVPAMQLILGQKVELVNQAGILVGDLNLPVMAMDYVGAVNTYLLVPLFAVLGVNVTSIRLLTVLAAGLTIIFSYFLSRELFDRAVAAGTIALLAVHPSFVFWSRQGIHVTSIMAMLGTASLLSLLIWRRTHKSVFLYLATFLLGLGLSAKLLFLWFIVALAASTFLLLVLPNMVSRLRGGTGKTTSTLADAAPNLYSSKLIEAALWGTPRLGPMQVVGSVLAFVLGAWMIILYNVMTGGTISVLSKNFFTTGYGVNNMAFFDNLLTSIGAFSSFLRGEDFWYLGGSFANDWYPTVLLVGALGTLALFIHPRGRRRWRSLLLPLAMLVLILIQSCITVSGLWSTHYFVTYPFPQLAIAAFAMTLIRLVPLKRLATAAVVVAIALLIVKDIYVNLQYHDVLSRSGGLFTHSDAIYRLAKYVDDRGVTEPIAMDWGIKPSVQILTQGRVNPIEIFQYQKDPNSVFLDWLYGSLTNRPNALYIFHSEENVIYPRYESFLDMARRLDKKVTLEQTILRRDGAPLFTVYSAR